MRVIRTIVRNSTAQPWRDVPGSRCRSTGACLGSALRLVAAASGVYAAWRMMVDRNDIGHLLSSTIDEIAAALRKAFDALCARQSEHGRGTRLVMGNALVGRLLYSLIGRNVHILTGGRSEKIVREADGAA